MQPSTTWTLSLSLWTISILIWARYWSLVINAKWISPTLETSAITYYVLSIISPQPTSFTEISSQQIFSWISTAKSESVTSVSPEPYHKAPALKKVVTPELSDRTYWRSRFILRHHNNWNLELWKKSRIKTLPKREPYLLTLGQDGIELQRSSLLRSNTINQLTNGPLESSYTSFLNFVARTSLQNCHITQDILCSKVNTATHCHLLKRHKKKANKHHKKTKWTALSTS